MDVQLGRNRQARRAYGLDEIALAPGRRTLDPSLVDTHFTLGGIQRQIPIIASAMDGVVDVRMAILLSELGAFGVLNLDGIQTRYADPDEVLDQIASVGKDEFVPLMQRLYSEPVKPELIQERIRQIKASGAIAAASCVPAHAAQYGPLVAEAGGICFSSRPRWFPFTTRFPKAWNCWIWPNFAGRCPFLLWWATALPTMSLWS